jgi:MFS family permease
MWGAYALAQFPSGLLAARFGERRVIVVALSLMTLGSLSLAASPSLAFFALAVLFLGAGTGLYFASAANLLSKLFANRGQAIGFTTAAGSVAGLVAPVVGAYVATRYGWRPAGLLGAVLALPLLVLFVFRVRPTDPDRPDQSIRDRIDRRLVTDFLSNPAVVYTVLLAAVGTFTFQSVTSFFPTYLEEHRGLSTQYAGLLFGYLFLFSALAQPVTGRLSDRVGRDAVIAGSMFVAATGFALLLTGARDAGLLGSVALLGAGLSWFPVVLSRFMDVLPDAERSVGFGLVRTVYMLFGALGSLVTGAIADALGWTAAYAVVVGLLGVCVAAIATNRAFRLGL